MENYPNKTGLYNPAYEHDACGIGAIASIKGIKTHKTIKDALNILIHYPLECKKEKLDITFIFVPL